MTPAERINEQMRRELRVCRAELQQATQPADIKRIEKKIVARTAKLLCGHARASVMSFNRSGQTLFQYRCPDCKAACLRNTR